MAVHITIRYDVEATFHIPEDVMKALKMKALKRSESILMLQMNYYDRD